MHTINDILDMVEHYWLPLDPNQTADWIRALDGLDLETAAETVVTMHRASEHRPSPALFATVCKATMARRTMVGHSTDWFAEQRAKLRKQEPPEQREEFHPES